MASLNKPMSEDTVRSLANARDRKPLRLEAEALERRSERALETHEVMERAATFFHIAIAVVAIAVLTRRRTFFFLSILMGLIGLVFFIIGLNLQMHIPRDTEGEAAKEHESAGIKPGEPHDVKPGEPPAGKMGEPPAGKPGEQHEGKQEPAAQH
jgi:hypothetical protein